MKTFSPRQEHLEALWDSVVALFATNDLDTYEKLIEAGEENPTPTT